MVRETIVRSAVSGKALAAGSLHCRLPTASVLPLRKHGKVFDSVLVVSDRNVIDGQLQDAIFGFERTTGVVATQGKSFAVIVDEAHSSQTGEAASRLKAVLSVEEQQELADGGKISGEDILVAQMANTRNWHRSQKPEVARCRKRKRRTCGHHRETERTLRRRHHRRRSTFLRQSDHIKDGRIRNSPLPGISQQQGTIRQFSGPDQSTGHRKYRKPGRLHRAQHTSPELPGATAPPDVAAVGAGEAVRDAAWAGR